jgi:type I restriction enzyme S subunit
MQNQYERLSAGGIVQNISSEIVYRTILLNTFFKEQQKIASCLSSLDDVMAAHSQKLEALKDHKKGLMQNLFPQEGESVPKWRFKEFEGDGEWVFEQFDQVYYFLVTNSFSREFLNYGNGTVKNIHYGDIHTKYSTLFDITKETVPFINLDVPIERIREECYCKEGDIIFADASEDLNDVGKSIEIVYVNNEKLLSGLHTLMARQLEFKIVTGFGGHLFLSNRIRKQIKREAQGAKVLGISGTRISGITIFYPQNHREQQKIAFCLSSFDELITAQSEKIEQLKLHKKGLMQGLFPKNDI